jgi:hypothetical protein
MDAAGTLPAADPDPLLDAAEWDALKAVCG